MERRRTLMPMRCFDCNRPLLGEIKYRELLRAHPSHDIGKVLDQMGYLEDCCRTRFITAPCNPKPSPTIETGYYRAQVQPRISGEPLQ